MPKKGKAIPDGYHTLTPSLVVHDGARAIEFYRKAFGAEERLRMPGPGGRVMHAELQIGDSIVFVSDEFPEMGVRSPKTLKGTPTVLHIYAEDVDAAFKRALDAGAVTLMPVSDMFWGDRWGKLVDPFGHEWGIATHKLDLTPAEMKKAQEEFLAKMPKPSKP